MANIINILKKEFQKGTILNRLIYINVFIFLIISVLGVFSFMFQFNIKPILNKLYLPADNNTLFHQPWTFITYMFQHNSFLHLLFNMVWLHFGGKIFLQYLKPKQLLATYILGGISGGLLFVFAYNYIPALEDLIINSKALGASASVLAIMIAVATQSPNHSIHLPFIGYIRLKQIAIICIILDVLSIPNGNAGGHIAHLGGAIFGSLYIKQLQKAKKANRFYKFINKLITPLKRNNKLKTIHKRSNSDYEFNHSNNKKEKEVDVILEKIAKSGYESLSKPEKNTLFNASKK